MFCKNCGKQLKDGDKFCPDCGTPVPAGSATPAPKAAPDAAEVPHANAAPRTSGSNCTNPHSSYTASRGHSNFLTRLQNHPFFARGKSFTFAHLAAIICCVLVVLAMFLPNNSSKLDQFLGYADSSTSIAGLTATLFLSEDDDLIFSALTLTCIGWIMMIFCIICSAHALSKEDRPTVVFGVLIPCMAGLMLWQCGGGLKGTGYVTMLLASLGSLVFSVSAYMLNQNRR